MTHQYKKLPVTIKMCMQFNVIVLNTYRSKKDEWIKDLNNDRNVTERS